MNAQVIVMLNFARSRGTLLNKWLGVLPYVQIFSEICARMESMKPTGYLSFSEQSQKWYGVPLSEGGLQIKLKSSYNIQWG